MRDMPRNEVLGFSSKMWLVVYAIAGMIAMGRSKDIPCSK